MKEERTLYQKIVLVILAAMIVVFGVVTAFNQSRKGILFRDSFLRLEEVTDADCFTGEAEGERVTILRWYGSENGTRTITLRAGDRLNDTYTVYLGEPIIQLSGVVSNVASSRLEVPTVRIAKNDAVLFEGGYQASSGFFFTSDGEWSGLNIGMSTHVAGADPWKDYTMSKSLLVGLALEPELVDRGDWRLYGLMVFFTLAVMVDVAFPYTLFRWRHHRWVKDPEPTDDYMSVQHLLWVILPVMVLVGYLLASMTLADVF